MVGEVEPLLPCPCCRYLTLEELGGYDICPVCFWEDDGTDDPRRVSGCNGLTLEAARANFRSFGANRRRDLPHVEPEGRARYPRAGAPTDDRQ